MEQQLEQAVSFFKSRKAYGKLFLLFKQKYESLGRIGGNVSIKAFSDEELEVISSFFGVPSREIRLKGTVSLLIFEKQLKQTRFDQLELKQLLDAYFGKIIISRKEQEQEGEEKLRSYLVNLKNQYPYINFWIDFLLKSPGEGRWIIRFAQTDQDKFDQLVKSLGKAFENLPQKAERLPLFSQRITGNPHAFDLNGDLGKMFLHLLAVHRIEVRGNSDLIVPTDTESISELLMEYKIYRDDLLNFVTCANLYAETVNGQDEMWTAAVKQQSVQIVPLRELIQLVRVYPRKTKKVWIVENSGVCSTLLDHVPSAPIICTNGQFTLATYMLLDLLANVDCTMYYAGDFDPEGLGMAARLVDRYPNHMRLWRMDRNSYEKSNPTQKLTEERLEKLKGITNVELKEVVDLMWEMKKAGYQEALIDEMIHDLQGEV